MVSSGDHGTLWESNGRSSGVGRVLWNRMLRSQPLPLVFSCFLAVGWTVSLPYVSNKAQGDRGIQSWTKASRTMKPNNPFLSVSWLCQAFPYCDGMLTNTDGQRQVFKTYEAARNGALLLAKALYSWHPVWEDGLVSSHLATGIERAWTYLREGRWRIFKLLIAGITTDIVLRDWVSRSFFNCFIHVAQLLPQAHNTSTPIIIYCVALPGTGCSWAPNSYLSPYNFLSL